LNFIQMTLVKAWSLHPNNRNDEMSPWLKCLLADQKNQKSVVQASRDRELENLVQTSTLPLIGHV
jgi:hypothetical protein